MTIKEITSNVFYYLSKEIKEDVCLGYINNIQNIDFENIKIKVHKSKTKQLIITQKTIFLASYDIQVMPKSLEFIRYLKKKLNNQRIQDVIQHSNNKLIYLVLDDYFLIFEFFSNSNIILLDKEYNVVSARRYERWKDREIIRNKKYNFPKCGNVLEIKEEEIKDLSQKEIISYIVKKYNIAPYYINKIFEKNNKLNKKEIVNEIKKLYEYENPKIEKKNDVLIIKKNEKKENLSKDIEKEYLSVFIEDKKEKETVNKKQKKINKIIETQEKKEKEFEKEIKNLKTHAEAIYVNFNLIEEINKQINIAIKKEIPKKEIIKKINDYFIKSKKNIQIKEINQKEKKYVLDIK